MSNPILETQCLVYEYVKSLSPDLNSVDYSWLNTEGFSGSPIRFQVDITRSDEVVLTLSIILANDVFEVTSYSSLFRENLCDTLFEATNVEPHNLVDVTKRALTEMEKVEKHELDGEAYTHGGTEIPERE